MILKYWKESLIVILCVGISILTHIQKETKGKYEREKNNVESLSTGIEKFKTKNNENAVRIKELQYTVEEYKERLSEDEKTIKSLKLKLKNVKEDIKTVTETKIIIKDSLVKISPDNFLFSKKDEWIEINQRIDFSKNPPVNNFEFHSRDSISHILYRVPKWKFLWWNIGTKCYEIYVVSHNPYSSIEYSRWINLSSKKKLRKRE